MTPKRFFFVMIAAFVLSIGGGAAMLFFANTLLEKRSSDVVGLKLESIELEEQLSAYRAAKANVEKYQYLNEIIQDALPKDKDQARTVREIFLLAERSGIKVRSIQFPSSTLGSIKAAPAAGSATAAAVNSTGITQAKAVEGLQGVYSVETIVTPYADTLNYIITYDMLIDFLEKIESNRRAMQVASLQLTPLGQDASDSISFTLTLNIFIKP